MIDLSFNFQEYIMSAFRNSSQIDCVYLDFSKEFDKVNHRILVAKMQGHGVGGSLLGWIRSYLSDRVHIVRCDGGYSHPFPVLSGGPQGSHLGPLLFALYINDISKVIQTRFVLFADDIKVFYRATSVTDQVELQRSIDGIISCCVSNAIQLKVSKCQAIFFIRNEL